MKVVFDVTLHLEVFPSLLSLVVVRVIAGIDTTVREVDIFIAVPRDLCTGGW